MLSCLSRSARSSKLHKRKELIAASLGHCCRQVLKKCVEESVRMSRGLADRRLFESERIRLSVSPSGIHGHEILHVRL